MNIVLLIIVAVIAGCGGASVTGTDHDATATELSITPPLIKAWWHDPLISMTQDAELVVTGQVISRKSYSARANWLPRAIIATTVTIKVDRVLKGTSAETIQIDILGGCLEGTCMDKSHEASFEDGERNLLFLTKGNAASFTITHGDAGKICLDGRYVRRNPEVEEISESELLAVVSNTVDSAEAVHP